MLTVLTTIDNETAADWLTTFARIRERRLLRQNDRSEVSVGSAMIHLLDKRNGLATIAGIMRGRFDERNASFRPGTSGARQRIYFEALPDDVAAQVQGNVDELLESLSEREQTIVQGLRDGYTQKEIALWFDLSEVRIGQIVKTIQEKIQNVL